MNERETHELKKYLGTIVGPIAATSGKDLIVDPVKEEALRKLLDLYINIFVDSGSYKSMTPTELPVVIAGLGLQTLWMLESKGFELVKLQEGKPVNMPKMPWDVQDKE